MKNKTGFAKKLLAIFLSLLMAVGAATPAFAMEELLLGSGEEGLFETDDADRLRNNISGQMASLESILKEEKPYKWDASLSTYEVGRMVTLLNKEMEPKTGLATVRQWLSVGSSVVRGISSVVAFVNSVVSLLKTFGVLETEADPRFTSISDSVKEIQAKVDDIDRKADAIQDTLTNEFAYIDLILLQQDYNHYKNDVWAQFYTDAVQPLNNLQTEYADGVSWLIISFAELWQDGEGETGLRALFGKNEETGEVMQVFSGRNMDEPGEKLPAVPNVSVDNIPVDYSVTLPAEYICANMNRKVALNNGNCLDELTNALEKGVYAAAEEGKLAYYSGFDSQWRSYSEEKKQETAKEIAAELLDSLAFACAYTEANEKGFAASVKNAYRVFTTWAAGAESLTSPLFARFKMLALTHGFEGEVREQIDNIYYYMLVMNLNYVDFAETVASMSRSLNENDRVEIRDMYLNAELGMGNEYVNFVTGCPNYCYQTESVIEYRNATVESQTQFAYGIMPDSMDEHTDEEMVWYYGHFSQQPWILYETNKNYSGDSNTAKQQKTESGEDLLGRSISSKQAAILYAMYGSSGSEGSFADYLAANNVTPDGEKVKDGIMTSMASRNFAVSDETKMTCYLPTTVGNYYFTGGKTYSVKSDLRNKLAKHHNDGSYLVHDQATGGYLNTKTGAGNENAILCCRTVYADHEVWPTDVMVAFSTGKNKNVRQYMSGKQQEEEYGEHLDRGSYETYKVTSTFYEDYGMLVSAPVNTYTFPEDTKSIPDYYFKNGAELDELHIPGTPENIGENAFAGVGTPADRCLLRTGFVVGSLIDKWHGGYFGNTHITVEKNDGSGEKERVVAVTGAPVSSVVCTFTAPDYAAFEGWSFYPNGSVVDPDENIPVTGGPSGEVILYAKWKYDHEHDFEVTKEGIAPTCTEAGCTEEKTCKTCGYVTCEALPAACHTCTYTKSGDNYTAKCANCDYEATLYPKVYGYHTVWSEDKEGSNSSIEYMWGTGGSIGSDAVCIVDDGVFVIQSNDPTNQYDNQTVRVFDGLNVSICLDGLKIKGGHRYVGFDIGKSNVHLTLKGENSITTWAADSLICAGNLTIDGDGSLAITANYVESNYYAPPVPINTTGAHTVIKGGNICALGGDLFSVMINSNATGGDMVIEQDACFYAEYGIDTVPVNGDGEKVYPVIVDNPEVLTIAVDAKRFPFKTLPGETFACIYLTSGKHDVRVIGGENVYVEDPDVGGSVLEKQYGDFTVLNPKQDEKAVEYGAGVLTVKKTTPITIKNTDPSTPTTDRIVIAKGVSADITLAGVNIQTGAMTGRNAITPVTIEEDSKGNVKITLADGSENVLVAGNDKPAISKCGDNGTLTIDGTGSLTATGGVNAAAIGSAPGYSSAGIIIDGGNIEAVTSGELAAAIGTGKYESTDFPGGRCIARNIVINGGHIKATSADSVAIGAGSNGKTYVKDITVNGGTVTAQSGADSCAIGSESAENIVINGGIITAEAAGSAGGTAGGIGGCSVVIEKTASVKASSVESPVNGEGKSVKLNIIPITVGEQVSIDGKGYRCVGHNGENVMYLYLADKDKIEKVPGITAEKTEKGKIVYSPSIPLPGDTVTLAAKAADGYSFIDYEITPAVEITDGTFVMPDEQVTVKGIYARIGTVTLAESEHGRVLPSKSIVTAGEKVNLYVMPEEGYELDTLTLTPETALEDDSFIMPEEDVTIACTFKPKANTVTWNIDGETTETVLTFGSAITKPEDPKKDGYNFTGWTPAIPETMPDGDLEFFAVFEPITYTATFTADGKEIAKIDYTINMDELNEPAVPEKDGCIGKWEEYTLKIGGITVKAEYTPITYKARFVADGVLVDEVDYTVETLEITEPAVPEKAGYTGAWNDYNLTLGGITVRAVYTLEFHEHTFEAKYSHNEAAHWFESTCGHDVAAGLAAHTFGEGTADGEATKYTCTVCGYVKTVTKAEEDTENLAAIISDAQAAVDKAAADGGEAVRNYAGEAKAAIGKLTSGSEVTKKLAEAISTINNMRTEKAVADALEYLDAIADSSLSSKAKAAAKQAKTAFKKAQTPEEVNAILANTVTEIEAAEQELGELCPDCGKAHGNNLWGRIICFFVRAYKWINDFISKVLR